MYNNKEDFRVPFCCTRWEHRALYNNTNNMHSSMPAHTRAHVRQGDRHGCEKDRLEIVTEQVCPEGYFKRGGKIKVAECLRQTVPNRWASVRI